MTFIPGPSTAPIPDEARAKIIHLMYTTRISVFDLAGRMKVSVDKLENVLTRHMRVDRYTHKHIMRFVKRLEKKP